MQSLLCCFGTLHIFAVLFCGATGFVLDRPLYFQKAHRRYPIHSTGNPRRLGSVAEIVAGLTFVAQLKTQDLMYSPSPSTMTLAVTETKQGLYREYTVEKVDDSALDAIKRSYKTAEETDTSKNKYWTILAVLVAGSFVIPMVQYFWYVAEED